MTRIRTIKEFDLRKKRILLRVDFNVPIEDGVIQDDWRIRAALPTIRYLVDRDCRITICSHLGRPKGKLALEFSLRPVAMRLAELLDQMVSFTDDCISDSALRLSHSLKAAEILVLENTRFYPEESQNDVAFAQKLARYADFFVDDAFAVAHREHASNAGVGHILPSANGLLMELEVESLDAAVNKLERPLVAIFGGVKISDKLSAINRISQLSDRVILGGGIANTAFKAKGFEVGLSLIDKASISSMTHLLNTFGEKIILPTSVVVRNSNGSIDTVDPKLVSKDAQILDVGSKSVDTYLKLLTSAAEIIWNGPLGHFEKQPFDHGTMVLARGLPEFRARVYVGGGDTSRALAVAGVRDQITHVSTGGGAFIDYLAGKSLPGLVEKANGREN